MGSLERRLERLEVCGRPGARRSGRSTPDYLEALFRALENHERVSAGLASLPLPYTDEDRRNDERFLQETLPAYRASPGWQTQEAQRVLDEWESGTIERLQRGARSHG